MKLKYKLFGGLAVLWIPFLILAYISAIKFSFIGFIVVAIVFSVLSVLLLDRLVSSKADEDQQLEPEPSKAKTHMMNTLNQANLIQSKTEKKLEQHSVSNVADSTVTDSNDTELMRQEFNKDSLSRFAHYDAVIDLPNRILFNELLNKALSHAKRHNKVFALLIVDVEPTNALSPNLRISLDNSALIEIGGRLAEALRTEDIIGKLEGNGFIVLLNDVDKPKFAGTVAKKLLNACAPSIQVDFQKLILKMSIGICIFPTDGSSLEELIKKAYQALQKAKNTEGDSYQFYMDKLDVESREYTRMDTDLRQAIQNNELVLYYQPKLRIKDGNIASVEALLRWMHPEYGMLSPAKFIHIAEESGLIMQIGEWALREACRTNKFWQEEGYEHIAVALNVSPKQFNHPNLTNIISSVLQETHLEPHYLELEISESTIMDNPQQSIEIINKLKELGVHVSIDHFGTGYTSINHLKQFPVTGLKIDRSFIKDIPDQPDDTAIASAIICLGHNLGMEVVAEGVETAEQMQYLTTQNCDLVQGYFLSYPASAQLITLQFKKLMDKVSI